MSAPKILRATPALETVIALGRLLERVEQSPVAIDADQYQVLVARLGIALQEAEPGEALQAVLDALPRSAELYENLHYEHAGLVRSPLEASLNAELLATQAIAKARLRAPDAGSR